MDGVVLSNSGTAADKMYDLQCVSRLQRDVTPPTTGRDIAIQFDGDTV
jgi:hypothetical protein